MVFSCPVNYFIKLQYWNNLREALMWSKNYVKYSSLLYLMDWDAFAILAHLHQLLKVSFVKRKTKMRFVVVKLGIWWHWPNYDVSWQKWKNVILPGQEDKFKVVGFPFLFLMTYDFFLSCVHKKVVIMRRDTNCTVGWVILYFVKHWYPQNHLNQI